MTERTHEEQVLAVAAISDPLRRRLFDFVSRSEEPVGRDEAASALGMARSTAAFHLDRLVAEGALSVEYKRLTGRTGPGSGRPAKLYRQAAGEIAVSIPDRRYELVGDVLASAVSEAARTGEPVGRVLTRVSIQTGREIGAKSTSLEGMLESNGYEPRSDGAGGIILTNCPFHRLATTHTDVVCSANLGLLQGAAEGIGDDTHDILFDPTEGHCCVRAAARQNMQDSHS
jgi:predicted ArsR family transcriptional regulator